MKFKVKDLSKCIGKSVTLPVAMEKFSNKILDFEPDKYHRVGIFMYDDWYFESEWLEPVEESAPTQENSTESGPTLLPLPEGSKGKVFTSTHGVVNRPDHYHFSDFEPIKVIQAWDLSFALGNVVKYIARAGRKDSSKLIEDLEKARKYLEFEIEHLKKGK